MNVSKFLDDTVRGTVGFVHGFVKTATTLLAHPLSGSSRLQASVDDPSSEQISSTTFLALAMVSAIGFLYVLTSVAAGNAPEGEEYNPVLVGAARFAATGTTAGIVPVVAGALAGTIVLSALLRLSTRLGSHPGPRRVYLVATLEYDFGFMILLGALLILAAHLIYVMVTGGPGYQSQFLPDWVGISVLATMALRLLPLAVRVAAMLSRRPGSLPLPLWVARRLDESVGPPSQLSLALERPERAPRRTKGRFVALFVAAYLGCSALLLSSLYSAASVYDWLWAQENPRPLRLLQFTCEVDGNGILRATALLLNRSDQVLLDWRTDAHVEIDAFTGVGRRTVTHWGTWHGSLPEDRASDLLRPGEMIELGGPVALPHRVQQRLGSLEGRCWLRGRHYIEDGKDILAPI
jgi:hypothetical protein